MVAATKQHVGKTTTSLALFSGIRKILGGEVGFMKPVGQTHVEVQSEQGQTLKVDKDVRLFKEFFNIKTCSYFDMSPVVIPSGYTRRFLDGSISESKQVESIIASYKNISEANKFSVVEGTGHCGVGAIVNLDNARVAALLGVDLILVVNGGLGSAFDELALNRYLCVANDVKIRGVVVNKVMPNKTDMIKEYFSKALKRWDIPLLGVVPNLEFLGRCTMIDYEMLFKQKLISGTPETALWHYFRTELIAMEVVPFLSKLAQEQHSKTLFVTHKTRADIVLAFLSQTEIHEKQWGRDWRGGLILAGSKGEVDPSLLNVIKRQNLPVLISNRGTHETMQLLANYTAKLNPFDTDRTIAAIDHYEKYIDFEAIINDNNSDLS